ncbi:MAG TPA: nucleotidyltransferase [Thermoanaerobaculia bacterium]|jgi:sugar phosphate isomerase/epimerase
MNRHFVEMLRALSAAGADYLVIGAHAVAAHGYLRGTRDLDVWIRPTAENAQRVWRALLAFGAPLDDLTVEDLSSPEMIFQVGVEPIRIDLLTSPAGVEFDSAWEGRVLVSIDGQQFPFLGREDLVRSKRASGRRQDLLDLDNLGAQ